MFDITYVWRYDRLMKAMLIYNPVAGVRDLGAGLDQAIVYLESQGWVIDCYQTFGPGDATTFARSAAAQGYDMAIAVGGDGTLGEVATGLAHSDCILGVLPMGTGNVWAHMLGLPVWSPTYRTSLIDAAHVLVEGQVRSVDLGRAGDRYFVLWSGIGFDAEVAHNVEPHRDIRRSLGNVLYLVTALSLTIGMRGTRVTVDIDGRVLRQRALLILVTNAQLYGHSWRVAPEAQLDDGLLDVHIYKGSSTIDVFRHFGGILLGGHVRDPKMETYRAKRVEIRSNSALPLHLDGDPAGYTPVEIAVEPRALRAVIPQQTSKSLFQDDVDEGAEGPTLAERVAARLAWERSRLRKEGERLRDDLGKRLGIPVTDDELS